MITRLDDTDVMLTRIATTTQVRRNGPNNAGFVYSDL